MSDIFSHLVPIRKFCLSHPGSDNIIKDYSVLWWSAKWLFEPEVIGKKVIGKQAIAWEDADILIEMWRLLNEADIIVVQNGKMFDIPKLNTRFLPQNTETMSEIWLHAL